MRDLSAAVVSRSNRLILLALMGWLVALLPSCARSPLSRPYTYPDTRNALHSRTESPSEWNARKKIVASADPALYYNVKYRKGASLEVSKATDCSKFVHYVYHRAGLPFAYRSTRDLRKAPEFVEISESEALPGDLMLFRGHVGIVDFDGKIISATRPSRSPATGSRTFITRQDRASFPPVGGPRGKRIVLRHTKLNATSD